ncbi:FMN-dependent dehydrogenase-domain-containing protein [Lipomyces tetrasporus]
MWAHIIPSPRSVVGRLKYLQNHWHDPMKGIQTVADASRARDYKVSGIVVSNHGGRQVDGSVASLDQLPAISAAVGNDLEILFDSGVHCGSDIAKAYALGAKAVLVATWSSRRGRASRLSCAQELAGGSQFDIIAVRHS